MTLGLLEALDVKKVIEHAAYFLLYSIALEFLFSVAFAGLPVYPSRQPGFEDNVIYFRVLSALLWGISRAIKTKYVSLKKAPLFLISAVFILSSICVAPNPDKIVNQFKSNATYQTTPFKVTPWKKLSTTRQWLAVLSTLLMMVLIIPAIVIGFFPVWMMLKSGYILTKIYFSSS